jgi:hypothetical protein
MWRHPCNILLYAQSNSGKSYLALDILKSTSIFDVKFDEVTYVYSIFNPRFNEFPNINFIKDDIPVLNNDKRKKLLICDDLLINPEAINRLTQIFLVDGHNTSTSCMFLLQDLHMNRKIRSLSLNTHIFIIFSHLRDKLAINNLFRQMALSSSLLQQAYKHVTKTKYGYLCINLQPGISDELRVSSDLTKKYPTFFTDKQLEVPFHVSFNV